MAATIKVMAENLNVGEKIYGFEDQEDVSKIERYCYNDDTTNCGKYGGLYQWAEAMLLPFKCNSKSCLFPQIGKGVPRLLGDDTFSVYWKII